MRSQGFAKERRLTRILMLLVVLAACSTCATAGNITEWIGNDDGAPTSGPFPASLQAQSQFEAAAQGLGSLTTITFEDLPTGYQQHFTAALGVTVDVNAPNLGPNFSGISDSLTDNVHGFNITPNGKNWFGFPQGSATFNFADGTQAFGFWLLGVDSETTSITVSFNDGMPQLLQGPATSMGGAAYFAFTDPGANIFSITITNTSNDFWGIDDVTFSGPPKEELPEPGSIILLASGVVGVGGVLRKKIVGC